MVKRVKMVRSSGSVFRDLGFRDPEARCLALRSEIMIRIEEFVEKSGLTQVRAAERLGLTQLRLNALLKGKIEQFSLDALVSVATRAGLQVDLLVRTPKRVGERVDCMRLTAGSATLRPFDEMSRCSSVNAW